MVLESSKDPRVVAETEAVLDRLQDLGYPCDGFDDFYTRYGRTKYRHAVPALLWGLRNSKTMFVRIRCDQFLDQKWMGAEVARALVDAYRKSAEAYKRTGASYEQHGALFLGTLLLIAPHATKSVADDLVELAAHPISGDTGYVLDALARTKDPRAYGAIMKAHRRTRKPAVLVDPMIVEALGRLGDPRGAEVLREALRSTNEESRDFAKKYLPRLEAAGQGM